MVSERLGGNSFAEVFYKLWHNDLPVFISCDALLQAWHRTYDAILEETEETYLSAPYRNPGWHGFPVNRRFRGSRRRRAPREPA